MRDVTLFQAATTIVGTWLAAIGLGSILIHGIGLFPLLFAIGGCGIILGAGYTVLQGTGSNDRPGSVPGWLAGVLAVLSLFAAVLYLKY